MKKLDGKTERPVERSNPGINAGCITFYRVEEKDVGKTADHYKKYNGNHYIFSKQDVDRIIRHETDYGWQSWDFTTPAKPIGKDQVSSKEDRQNQRIKSAYPILEKINYD